MKHGKKVNHLGQKSSPQEVDVGEHGFFID